jgi:hypothetical protein
LKYRHPFTQRAVRQDTDGYNVHINVTVNNVAVLTALLFCMDGKNLPEGVRISDNRKGRKEFEHNRKKGREN